MGVIFGAASSLFGWLLHYPYLEWILGIYLTGGGITAIFFNHYESERTARKLEEFYTATVATGILLWPVFLPVICLHYWNFKKNAY